MRLGLSAKIEWLAKTEGILFEGLKQSEAQVNIARFRKEFRKGPVRPITTHGIRLGMTESEVVSRLGMPQKAFWSKKYGARELLYSRDTKKDNQGQSYRYTNFYLFTKGRLAMIELSRSMIGGG